MAVLAGNEPLMNLGIEKIHALNLEGELSGELNYHSGSCSETLSCYGTDISPIKCAGCDKAIMLFTFYDQENVEDSSGNTVLGRVILCGSFDPYKICRQELEHVPRNGVYDMYRCRRNYYCSDTCPSGRLTGCLEKTAPEVDCENPFMRVVFTTGVPELLQDRVQQLCCPEGCKGQCLLDACVRYADDTFNSKKSCPECKRLIWIHPVEPFEEFMEQTEKGFIGASFTHRAVGRCDVNCGLICGHIKSTRGLCTRCDEYLDIYGCGGEIPEPKGCIGLNCDGKCLDQHVKNYIVPRSLKRDKN